MKLFVRQIFIFVASALSVAAMATDFDGSEPLICSFGQVIECDAQTACRAVTNDMVDAPEFVKIDFKRKRLVSTTAGEDSPADDINVSDVITHIIVQGSQGNGQGNALGYSLSIDQASGQMVAAGAGENAGFLIFGACTSN